MKFAIPEISWHNRDPVLSVDFQPKAAAGDPLRLATGGTDSHVLIWYVSTTETGSVNLEVAADLTRHQKAVNVVRWSPSGELLASGDDESIIFIWKQKNEEPAPNIENGEEVYKESWVIHKIVKFTFNEHFRVFRTFDISTKKVISRSSKATLPFPPEHRLHSVRVRLFHDDTLQTYFRRLQFSPDGMLIAVPAGRIEPEQSHPDMKPINAVYIYTRYSLKVPACVLPCGEAALVTRWSPRSYALRPNGPPPAFPIQRRMLLAVATKRSVLLYDTQQKTPIAMISNIHYTRLTDLSWSPEGRTLVASSTDGFCSVITFSDHELGEVLPEPELDGTASHPEPMEIQKQDTPEPKEKPEASEPKSTTPKINSYMKFKTPSEKSPKKRTKTENDQQKTPVKLDVLMETAMQSWSDNSQNDVIKPVADKLVEVMEIDDSGDIKLVYEDTECSSQLPTEGKSPETAAAPKVENAKREKSPERRAPPAPRRVSFVTLSSPKNKRR
ncbi:chromatin assembly factor 1 subunit B [Hyposmocoma kahamanoa]|uniref:chromatin assembly factor 1 subunit B n=1 Tax=Hyposmocoma kahamanoa TaxID=1477025 RepID=UPI000E6D6EEB|nr:chromatin assembly factor 1 subunit B [Hyposmocoma kahamanoa]